MRIGCIGWGSLLWDPRSLPMAGGFRADGPLLPIEFSRVAMDGRVTLVIDPAAQPIPTSWVAMAARTLDDAIVGLGRRERIAEARWPEWIGAQTREHPAGDRGEARPETRQEIARWLPTVDLDAAIWTALPARRPDGVFDWPDTTALLDHLRSLEGDARRRAEEYIRRAPDATRTARRARFESTLGWTPADLPPNPATPGAPE